MLKTAVYTHKLALVSDLFESLKGKVVALKEALVSHRLRVNVNIKNMIINSGKDRKVNKKRNFLELFWKRGI